MKGVGRATTDFAGNNDVPCTYNDEYYIARVPCVYAVPIIIIIVDCGVIVRVNSGSKLDVWWQTRKLAVRSFL